MDDSTHSWSNYVGRSLIIHGTTIIDKHYGGQIHGATTTITRNYYYYYDGKLIYLFVGRNHGQVRIITPISNQGYQLLVD